MASDTRTMRVYRLTRIAQVSRSRVAPIYSWHKSNDCARAHYFANVEDQRSKPLIEIFNVPRGKSGLLCWLNRHAT